MMAYSSNYIRLNARDLPISAEIDNIEQVAVPRARTAVKVLFPVRAGRAALIKLALDDGLPAPVGAVVELMGSNKGEFFVARRGEVFVTGLLAKNEIQLKHNQQSCTVTVKLPTQSASIDEIVRLGPLICSGVKR
jgi:outer membrane usher protein